MIKDNLFRGKRMHSLRHFVGVLLAGLVLAAPGVAAQGEQVGVITSVDGTWFRAAPGTPAVEPGNRVFRADSLSIRAGFTARKHIGAVLRGGRHVVFTCPARGRCDQAFVPADSLRERSLVPRAWAALVDGVYALFSVDQPAYAHGLVREGPGADEAVLRLRNGAVDVAPVLRGARTGSYLLRFRPAGAEMGGGAADPVYATWEEGREEVPVAVPRLAPGLYEVEVRPAGAAERPGAAAWVLVAAEGFEAREQAFRGVQELVAGWSGASASEKRAFLRAALDCLSRGDPAAPAVGCA